MDSFEDLEKRIRKLEEKLTLTTRIIESMREGLLILDEEGRIREVNRAFTHMTGFEKGDVEGKVLGELELQWEKAEDFGEVMSCVRREGLWRGEVWGIHRSGSVFVGDAVVFRSSHSEEGAYVVLMLDTTHRRNLEASLNSLTYYDPVTGLPNRALLIDHITRSLSRARSGGGLVGVIFMDINNFKLINDTLGHERGDELLKAFSEKLSSCFSSASMISRFGGDEFVVVLEGVDSPERVESALRSFFGKLREPIRIGGKPVYISVTAGVSLFPVDGNDAQTLLRNADIAMHNVKDAGENRYRFFTKELNLRVNERFTIELRLREALGRDEFRLLYQPQYDLSTGRIVGAEALIRWFPGEGEVVLPGRFIHVAEETDLIIAIGDWVLRQACRDGRRLLDLGYRLRIGVNISAKQLSYLSLERVVEEVIGETGFDPSLLELEITESTLMRNKEKARETLGALRSLGVGVAIDDFGTSYSSLNYLKLFPVDTLKIDRSFIGDLISDPSDVAIATTIIAIAHNLGLKAVAEGVETKDQLTFLKLWQCDEAQGFYLSPPIGFSELLSLLRNKGVKVNGL